MANRQIKDLTQRGAIDVTDIIPIQGVDDVEAGANSVQQLQDYLDNVYAQRFHNHPFGAITETPTTLAGYGITDAAAVTFKEYRAMLFQNGTTPPQEAALYVDTISHNSNNPSTDPLFRLIDFTRTGVGDYTLKIFSNIANQLNSFKTEISFSDGKVRTGTRFTSNTGPYSTSEFLFSTYTPDGTKSDSQLAFTNVSVKIYQ